MRIVGNLLLLAVVVAVISFFAAPAALARLVDYAAVRQSLRPQLAGDPAAQAPAPSFLEDPIAAVRRRFEEPPVPAADVDAYLSPAAIAALTRGEGRFASQRTAATPSTRRGDPLPAPVYWGVNRARLAVTDEGGSRTIFTFERRGPFEWRLAHVGLPEGVAPAAAPVPAPAPGT